jgi:hypothetical protein
MLFVFIYECMLVSNTISISDDVPTVEPRALVEQYRFTLPDHVFTPGFFSSVLFVCLFGGSVAHSYVFCGNVLWTNIFLLIIVLFVLRLTTSDTHFGSSHFSRYNWNIVENGVEYNTLILKLFLSWKKIMINLYN